MSGKQTAAFVIQTKSQLPACVQKVLLRADGEFLSWESVQAAISCGYDFIIANKRCDPPFDSGHWCWPWKHKDIEYNSCIYQPIGWGAPCRFVAMRIPKTRLAPNQQEQCLLFEDDNYTYRIFCTNLSGQAHEVVA